MEYTNYPSVSIIVSTYNSPHFYGLIYRNWDIIQYPKNKIEMIILDDSEIKNDSTIFKKDPRIKFLTSPNKLSIGCKRNILCKQAKNEYIVHMNDNCWYSPESVELRIKSLFNKDKCYVKNSSIILNLLSCKMYMKNDINEGSMAYPKRYWESQKWDNSSVINESVQFLKNRTDTITSDDFNFIINLTNSEETNVAILHDDLFTNFQDNMTAYDLVVFDNLRAKVIMKIPEYRKSLDFVSRVLNYEYKDFIKEYNKLDNELKTNHLIINIFREKSVQKTTTSGKDLVIYYETQEQVYWNPQCINNVNENNILEVSNYLVNKGYNVTVYTMLKGEEMVYNNVMYKNHYKWIPRDLQDFTIIWDCNIHSDINSKFTYLFVNNEIKHPIPKGVKVITMDDYKNIFTL